MLRRLLPVLFLTALLVFPAAVPAQRDRGDETEIEVTIRVVTDDWGEPEDTGKPHAMLKIRNDLDRSADLGFKGPSRYDESVRDRRTGKLNVAPGRYEVRVSASALSPWMDTYQFEGGREYAIRVRSSKIPSTAPGTPGLAEDPDTATAAGGDVIFNDDFDYSKPEWQQVGGFWETSNGLALQKTDDPRTLNAIRYIKTPRISDATIETELRVRPYWPTQFTDSDADRQLQHNIRYIVGGGIVFRMKDPDNFYMFRLAGEEGAVLGRMVGGEWFDIENPRVRDFLEGFRLGFRDTTYKLRVEIYANRIKCYINGEPVVNTVDNTFSLGHVGLVTFKTAAEFEYLKITR
jgi:hypothetical protein